MGREYVLGRKAVDTKVSMKMAKFMGTECLHGQMVDSIQGIGLMESKKVKECIEKQEVRLGKLCGKKARGFNG